MVLNHFLKLMLNLSSASKLVLWRSGMGNRLVVVMK